eukprot:jgi/Bigna1/83566/fgenesh1_pg.110_\
MPFTTTTGDVKGQFEKFRRLLVKIAYKKEIEVDLILKGYTKPLLPVLHYVILQRSTKVARYFAERGHVLSSSNDQRFIEGVYRIMRSEFSYRPRLSLKQFLSDGFAEQKIIFLCDIMSHFINKEKELTPKRKRTKLRLAAYGKPPLPSRNNGDSASKKVADQGHSAQMETTPKIVRTRIQPKEIEYGGTSNPWELPSEEITGIAKGSSFRRIGDENQNLRPEEAILPVENVVREEEDADVADFTIVQTADDFKEDAVEIEDVAAEHVSYSDDLGVSKQNESKSVSLPMTDLINRLGQVETCLKSVQQTLDNMDARFVILEGKVKFLEAEKKSKRDAPAIISVSNPKARSEQTPITNKHPSNTQHKEASPSPQAPLPPKSSITQKIEEHLFTQEKMGSADTPAVADASDVILFSNDELAGVSFDSSLSTDQILQQIDRHFQQTRQLLSEAEKA